MPEPTQEEVKTEEVPQEKVQENTQEEVSEEQALENSKNPERTKQYIDKLKKEREQYKNVLESLKPSQQPEPQQQPQPQPQQVPSAQQFSHLDQGQVNNVFQGMIDSEGYLDGNKLMATLQQMNDRAMQAEQRAQRVEEHMRRRETAELESQKSNLMKEVHAKYPQLDPDNEEFNEDFYETVRNDLIGQMMEGREDPMAAADKWAKRLDMTKKEKEQVEKVKDQKAQINASRPRSTMMKGYYEQEEEQALVQAVRQGKKGSIAEALRRAGQ